jgi:hypothetical protein
MKFNATCTLQAIHIKTGKVFDMCQFDSEAGDKPLQIEAVSQEEADEKWSRRCLIEVMHTAKDRVKKDYREGKWK